MRNARKMTLWSLVIVAISLLLFVALPSFIQQPIVPDNSVAPEAACDDVCSLVIEPDAGIAPVRAMMHSAKKSIDLVMYELEDKNIENDLVAAHKRGVAVRVLLSPGYQGEPSAVNESAYDVLRDHGVAVRWSPVYFALTHEKSLVIDEAQAFIMSFNLVPKYYPTGRDFGIIDRDMRDVAAIGNTFTADWQGSGGAASAGDDLVWSPGSRSTIIPMIDAAQISLDIDNEEMADDDVTSALIRAVRRGVTVRVDMTYSPNWKSAFIKLSSAGVSIRTYAASAALYIHAKMIIADGARAFVGSENFSETSLDQNRELGIMVSNGDVVDSLEATFGGDWQGAAPFVYH